jgi:Ser/Thr protein kinase RdoA (MazF antagonist)
VLSHHADRLPAIQPRLLHGDWTARHVITDNGAVTGVVDLESVRGGHPLTDIAGWSLQEPAALTDGLLIGYFSTRPSGQTDLATCTVLTVLRLRIAMSLLADHLARADTTQVRLRTAQLHADLADLACGQPPARPRISSDTPLTALRTVR